MQYKDIISISNLSGLFKMVGSKSDGAIVKGLEDDVTKFLSSRKHTFTPLDSIEVYTNEDNIPLKNIFENMKTKKADVLAFDIKKASKDELYTFILGIVPNLDTTRVYASDIKKMIKWFRILDQKSLLNFEEQNAIAENTENKKTEIDEFVAEKPKKAPAKKSKTTSENEQVTTIEEKPKKVASKKVATKKENSLDENIEAPKKKSAPKKKKED